MAGLGVQPHIVEATIGHTSGFRAGVAGIYNREAYAAERRAAAEVWSAHVERVVRGADVVPLRRA